VRHLIAIGLGLALLSASLPAVGQSDWSRHVNDEPGFSIEVPLGMFEVIESTPSITRFRDPETDALLEVYGGTNRDGLSLPAFIDFLSEAERIAEITYRAGGQTWFVISGYYRREGFEDGSLIFYAKFMFSADLERFSAFEISYPAIHKERMDPVVERLESSLQSPD
jgi:hypothetical protein